MILNANQFLEQFKNKFIPFELKITTDKDKIIDSIESEDLNITVDIVNSSVELKKVSEEYQYSKLDDQITSTFEITTSDDKKVAYVDLTVTSSGKIVSQHIQYYSSDNLRFIHSIYTDKHTSIPYETFTFEKGNKVENENIEITQVDNNVVGANYSSTSLNDEAKNHSQTSILSSLFTKPTFIGDFLKPPYLNQGLDGILLNYNAAEARFKEKVHLNDYYSEEELKQKINKFKGETIYDKYTLDITESTLQDYLDLIAAYLDNKEHNLLRGFKGNFIGSILKNITHINKNVNDTNELSDSLVVVTERKKYGQTYHCYTILNNPDIKTIVKANNDAKEYITPKYVTKIVENGEEELAFADGKNISTLSDEERKEEEASYAKFVNEYITPYSGLQPIIIDQFMQPKELSQEPR